MSAVQEAPRAKSRKAKVLRIVGIISALLGLWVAALVVSGLVVTGRVPVSLPPSMVLSAAPGYAIAEGTWAIRGEQEAFPFQTTTIHCNRETRRCTSATAQVGFGGMLHASLDYYDIVEWGASRVVFTHDTPLCVRYVYTMDLATKVVAGLRERKKNTAPDLNCAIYSSELHLSLDSGVTVWSEAQKAATPWFGELAILPLRWLFN